MKNPYPIPLDEKSVLCSNFQKHCLPESYVNTLPLSSDGKRMKSFQRNATTSINARHVFCSDQTNLFITPSWCLLNTVGSNQMAAR
jgi:hypothetical protein